MEAKDTVLWEGKCIYRTYGLINGPQDYLLECSVETPVIVQLMGDRDTIRWNFDGARPMRTVKSESLHSSAKIDRKRDNQSEFISDCKFWHMSFQFRLDSTLDRIFDCKSGESVASIAEKLFQHSKEHVA